MNRYSHAQWIAFREEMIKLDNGQCVRCFRSRSDGASLQVHHKFYVSGRLPWEYAYTDCETLCRRCHAEEHGRIMPQSGWILVGTDDLGDLCGNCECCGTDLRYVFAIVHPHWRALAVGTVCCDRLTATTEASEYHNHQKKLSEARKRFLSSRRWSAEAGDWTIKQRGIAVRVSRSKEKFFISMNGANGKRSYDTLFEAKLRVFESIESGEAIAYLQERQRAIESEYQRRMAALFKRNN